MTLWHIDHLWQTDGSWQSPAFVETDPRGAIVQVAARKPARANSIKKIDGWVVPGMVNAHSHAFQFAMAGLAEHLPVGAGYDDFWTWREAMYRLALTIKPKDLKSIVAMAYARMLAGGYTHVVEFHYLHHDESGKPYKQAAALAQIHVEAAEEVGIGITLTPVFYKHGGFGKPAQERQRRFLFKDVSEYLRHLDLCRDIVKQSPNANLGCGVHSLRASSGEETQRIFAETPHDLPFHLHAAEQVKEVEECRAATGQSPIAWILDHLQMGPRVNITHATHMTPEETKYLGLSGATVVLCPSTEGNLGDGVFPLGAYLTANGRFALGTDSHIGMSPFEDLRWLDYGQRLYRKQRNVLATIGGQRSADCLYSNALSGGWSAAGLKDSPWAMGKPFDAVILDPEHIALVSKPDEDVLSAAVYAGEQTMILGVIARGRQLIKHQTHRSHQNLMASYRTAMRSIWK